MNEKLSISMFGEIEFIQVRGAKCCLCDGSGLDPIPIEPEHILCRHCGGIGRKDIEITFKKFIPIQCA